MVCFLFDFYYYFMINIVVPKLYFTIIIETIIGNNLRVNQGVKYKEMLVDHWGSAAQISGRPHLRCSHLWPQESAISTLFSETQNTIFHDQHFTWPPLRVLIAALQVWQRHHLQPHNKLWRKELSPYTLYALLSSCRWHHSIHSDTSRLQLTFLCVLQVSIISFTFISFCSPSALWTVLAPHDLLVQYFRKHLHLVKLTVLFILDCILIREVCGFIPL